MEFWKRGGCSVHFTCERKTTQGQHSTTLWHHIILGGNYVNAITMTGFGTYVPIVQRTTTLRLQWLLMIEWNVVVNMHMDFNGLFLFVYSIDL